MSLLKDIQKEAATKELIESAAAGSTSAGAIAGFRGAIGNATSEKTKMFARNIPKYFSEKNEYEEDEERSKKRRKRRTGGPVTGTLALRFENSRMRGVHTDSEDPNAMECPSCKDIAFVKIGSTDDFDEYECENCKAYGTFDKVKKVNEGPEDEKFDPADVVSKLRAAQEKANKEDNTAGFALEDGDGQIIKVYVAADEAEEFERALGAALSGEDEDDDEENTSLEIAEVLFNLKDRFSIVDVVWPPIDGDPEEQETTGDGDLDDDTDIDAGGEGAEGDEGGEDLEGDEGSLDDAEGDMEADLQADGEGEGEDLEGGDEDEGVKSALDAVIDLLRAQADATKAEANAKEAEANAEEAKSNASVAELKMKQEEEVLDMEASGDKVKKAEQEAKKLKDLAKWRHQTAQTADDALNADTLDADVNATKEIDIDVEPPQEEEEERNYEEESPEDSNVFMGGYDRNNDRRMQPGEFIRYMFKNAGKY